MSRQLHLLRHAKSSWDESGIEDAARPLNARGERAALLIGHHLARLEQPPELVLCSPAIRCRQTVDVAFGAANLAPTVEYLEQLYLANVGTLVSVIRGVDDGTSAVMLVGHNPGLHDFANRLARLSRDPNAKLIASKFPTCALACYELAITQWRQAGPDVAQLMSYTTPKDLT